MKRRKSLNPFWAWWFVVALLFPLHVGFTVWVSQLSSDATWFGVASVLYVILHGIGASVVGIAGENAAVPLLVELSETPEERERRLLDEEFPG